MESLIVRQGEKKESLPDLDHERVSKYVIPYESLISWIFSPYFAYPSEQDRRGSVELDVVALSQRIPTEQQR
ncbi:hypothetical protein [Streptosporangium sp. NPDC001681]|uniref:hypothetical protein n=1 Tax=Streptosporangium sp. NPDC001681 TaxID=3154395 RepID=UPI0033320A40